MEERYPYMRFVIGAAQPIAGTAAALFALGGLMRACRFGGFGGFVSFVLTLLIAVVIYVTIHVWIESLRLFIDIERNSRGLLDAAREPSAGGQGPTAPPA
jgi:predicted lipid-binding transport protein (Tim44 family)